MSEPMASNGQAGWRVTSQTEATDRDVTGNFVDGVRIYFLTAGGATGSIFLSTVGYTAANVRAAISAKAAIMDHISTLTG